MNIIDAIDNLSSTASNMKNNFDKKSTQILNKTSAVFEKVKLHENSLTNNTSVSADATVSQSNQQPAPQITNQKLPPYNRNLSNQAKVSHVQVQE